MEQPQSLAPIAGVPIMHPRSSKGSIYLPLSAGDMVTLLVSDRDLSRWKAGSGQETAPQMARAHDLADCWAFPGGYPDGVPPAPRFPGAVEVNLELGTGFAVGNGIVELIDLLVQFIELELTNSYIGNLGYPTGTLIPTQALLWSQIKLLMETLKAE